MLDTSVRLLRLLSLLQSRHVWAGAELASRLEVTGRTVRNDVERLRILGYQVDSTTGVGGGYRLGAGTAVPPLLFDDEEAVAVALGLRAAASGSITGIEEVSLRALAKIEQSLPSRLRHRVDGLRSSVVTASGRGPTVDADVLTALSGAARDRRRLRFDYRDHEGAETVRSTEPRGLVYTGHRWFLVAWDLDRGDWRTFRADRIRPRLPAGPGFVPHTLSDADAATLVLRGAGSTAWPVPATIRFLVPADQLSPSLVPAEGLLTPDGENSCVLHTGSDTARNLAVYLMRFDLPFEVLDPPELRDELARLAGQASAAAGAAE